MGVEVGSLGVTSGRPGADCAHTLAMRATLELLGVLLSGAERFAKHRLAPLVDHRFGRSRSNVRVFQ
jgi:hypothetical protein